MVALPWCPPAESSALYLQPARDTNHEEQHKRHPGLRDCHINPLKIKQPFLFIYQNAYCVFGKTSKNVMKPRNLLWEAVMVIECTSTQTSVDRCGFALPALPAAAWSCAGAPPHPAPGLGPPP